MAGENQRKMWSFEIGLYPGVLLGIRTYKSESENIHVFYLPLIDFAIRIEK